MRNNLSRRWFLQQTALGAAGLCFAGCQTAPRKPSAKERLNVGVIGVANQGNYNLNNVAGEHIAALCDVDDNFLGAAKKRFPAAKTYNDFRRLLDQRELDAVVVATPDHTHAVATVAALKSGRHVYCEKALTRTISECRIVMETARKLKAAGLHWEPAQGDRFEVPERGMDDRVFVINDMATIIEMIQGAEMVTFHGTPEWALDYVYLGEAVWLPDEGQLRELSRILRWRGMLVLIPSMTVISSVRRMRAIAS